MTWAEQMLAELDAPSSWSPARIRAEAEFSQVWRGRRGVAIAKGSRVVRVERVRRRQICANQEIAA